jgi:hypothetical protein
MKRWWTCTLAINLFKFQVVECIKRMSTWVKLMQHNFIIFRNYLNNLIQDQLLTSSKKYKQWPHFYCMWLLMYLEHTSCTLLHHLKEHQPIESVVWWSQLPYYRNLVWQVLPNTSLVAWGCKVQAHLHLQIWCHMQFMPKCKKYKEFFNL